jgi:hypothetical protein
MLLAEIRHIYEDLDNARRAIALARFDASSLDDDGGRIMQMLDVAKSHCDMADNDTDVLREILGLPQERSMRVPVAQRATEGARA